MSEMGRYCKAYLAKQFAAFSSWQPDRSALRDEAVEGTDASTGPRELQDEDILYLQEDLTVTDGIFLNEHVVFASDDSAWKTFCGDMLGFVLPDDVVEMERAAQAAATAHAESEASAAPPAAD